MKSFKQFLFESHLDKFFKQHGIVPEKGSIGFSEKEQKWYGWSNRAIYGFGIGFKVKEGDSFESNISVGFKAKTLNDCKKLAKSFASSVS